MVIMDQVIVNIEGADYMMHVYALSTWTPNTNKEGKKYGEESNAHNDEEESKYGNGDNNFELKEKLIVVRCHFIQNLY